MDKFKTEIKLILFYIIYVAVLLISNIIVPNGTNTPRIGFFLLMLLIPLSIILFIIDLFKYFAKPNRIRLHLMAIHVLVWLTLFLVISFLKK